MEFRRYLNVLRRRWWLILLVALVAGGVTYGATFNSPRLYTAQVTFRVVLVGINLIDYGTFVYFDRLASTYSAILNTTTVADQAKQRLNIDKVPKARLETIPQTELMRLLADAETPELAQKYADTLADILIRENQRTTVGSDSVINDLRAKVELLQKELDAFTKQLSDLEQQLPRDEAKIAQVQSDLDRKRQDYNIASAQYNQASTTLNTLANALTVVEYAPLPEGPSSRSPVVTAILASVVGLLGGLVLAFVLESFDSRLYGDDEAAKIAKAPVIGKIPVLRPHERADVFNTNMSAGESFRRLRINLMPSLDDSSKHIFLVTSSVPEEGKSTTATNFSRAVAHIVDQCVVLIDADLRRPSLHTIFDLPNEVGLTDVLKGTATLRDVIHDTNEPNLKVITSGAMVPNPTELMGSKRMVDVIETLLREYRTIIFDTPPVQAAVDSAALAKYTDGVVLVLDRAKSDDKAFSTTVEQLNKVGAKILGVVANRVRKAKDFKYYGYYGYDRKRNRAKSNGHLS